MLASVKFVVACLVGASIVGLPLASLLPRGTFHHRLLAAPALGLAACGAVVTALYVWGVPPSGGALATFGLGLLGCVVTVRRWRPEVWRRETLGIVACLAVLTLATMGPAWVGGPAFTAFQGNSYDALNYDGMALSYRLHSFAALRAMMPGDSLSLTGSFAYDASKQLATRPAVAIVFASLYRPFFPSPVEAAYPYMAALTVIGWSASTFLLVECFGGALWICGLIGAAFSLGFFGQFITDLNAVAEIAGTPVAVSLLAVFLRGMTARVGLSTAAVVAVLVGGLLYLYPEMSAVYGTAIVASAMVFLLRSRRMEMVRRLAVMALGAGGGVLICLPFWNGSAGLLVTEPAAVDLPNEWATSFFGYVFAFPYRGIYADSFQHISADVAYVADGLLGAYFVQAWTLPWPLPPLFLVVACGLALVSNGLRRRIPAIIACLGALTVPLILLAVRHDWAAGKAFSMASPLWLALLLSPLLARGRALLLAAPAVLILALQLGFGVERFVEAAALDGVGRTLPYPNARELKRTYVFDTYEWDRRLAGCRAIQLSVEEPSLSRMAQIYLVGHRRAWSTPDPIVSPFGNPPLGTMSQIDDPDCLMTDAPSATSPGRVVDLRRPPRPPTYDGSPLEIAVADATRVAVSGMAPLDIYPRGAARWTYGDGSALVLVTSEERPVDLVLVLSGVSAAVNVHVTLNGRTLYDGPQQVGETVIPIPSDVPPGLWTFGIISGEGATEDARRTLGVYLVGLQLR